MLEMLRERKAALEAQGKKGFTLMEMLIVIAIIAILIAIAIPIFTTQLERAHEATDAANIRATYAEVMTSAIDKPASTWSKSVPMTQTQADWQDQQFTSAMNQLFSSTVTPTGTGTSVNVVWVPGTGTVEGHMELQNAS